MEETMITHLPGNDNTVNLPRHRWNVGANFFLAMYQILLYRIQINLNTEHFSRERDTENTDLVEIKALLGLLYLAAILRSSRLNVDDIWDWHGIGVERFWLTMTKTTIFIFTQEFTF